jgi:hypothetical protein
MTKDNDPLASLISNDAQATDRKKLAELLVPYIVIDQDSKEFGFLQAFHDVVGNDTKIELLLAGAKARALYFNMEDGLLPGEIIAASLMPEGSAKTSVKKLFDKHQIKKNKEGRYFLPAHRVTDIIKKISIIKK